MRKEKRRGRGSARLRYFSITGTRAQGYSINGGYRALAASTFITETSSASAFPDFHPGDDESPEISARERCLKRD